MSSTQRLALPILALALLAGCGGAEKLRQSEQPDAVFERGVAAMNGGNLMGAIDAFQSLLSRYPNSPESRQAELDIIYAFYRARRDDEALDAAQAFARQNPTHPRVDYALYMEGLIHFDKAPGILERWFDVDMTERPPTETLDAFNSFQDLIRRFPDSRYVADARQRMIFLRNRLASYQNHVAQFYMERGAYVAAAQRAKYAIETYPGAPELEDSLTILLDAYERLGMRDLADDTRRVLEESFPNQSLGNRQADTGRRRRRDRDQ